MCCRSISGLPYELSSLAPTVHWHSVTSARGDFDSVPRCCRGQTSQRFNRATRPRTTRKRGRRHRHELVNAGPAKYSEHELEQSESDYEDNDAHDVVPTPFCHKVQVLC